MTRASPPWLTGAGVSVCSSVGSEVRVSEGRVVVGSNVGSEIAVSVICSVGASVSVSLGIGVVVGLAARSRLDVGSIVGGVPHAVIIRPVKIMNTATKTNFFI
jgi:hypothetical protein